MNFEDLTIEEQASVNKMYARIGDLCRTCPRLLSAKRESWLGPPPASLMTPELVRHAVGQAFVHVYDSERRNELIHFILNRLTINDVRFYDWEQDPSVILRSTRV